MYRAVGDIWGDIASTAGGVIGGVLNPQPSAPQTPGAPAPATIYCPEQAALVATAAAMYPNNSAMQTAFLLTNGPGLATPGGWAGWCALKKMGLAPGPAPAPVDQGMHYAPPPSMPMTPAVGTTATPWTTYAAIGAGVLGLGGLVWYLKK